MVSKSRLEYLSEGVFIHINRNNINLQQLPPTSDPPQHASDPPVARHHDLTDDPASLVVVRPGVESAQGLVVASTVAVTTATVLAAEAAVIQVLIQLDSNIPLKEDTWVTITHMTNASPPEARAGQRERRRSGWRGWMGAARGSRSAECS